VVAAALYASESISEITGYSLFARAQVGDNSAGTSGDPELLVGSETDSVAFHTCWDSTPYDFDTGARTVQLTANAGDSGGATWGLQGSSPVSQTYTEATHGALGQVQFRAGMAVPGLVQWSSIFIEWYRNGQIVDSFSRRSGPTVDERGSTEEVAGEEVLVVSTSVKDADKVVIWGKVENEYEQGITPAANDLFAEVFVFPAI